MTSNKLLWTAAAIAFPLGMAQAQAPASAPAASESSVSAPGTAADTAVSGDQGASAGDVAATGSTGSTATDSAATADASSTQSATAGQPVAVSKADVRTGATVLGSDGSAVGKIESVSADAAVVSTGKAKAQIPFTSFGKTDKGLVIAMSKSQFEAAASGKSAS